MAESEPRGGCEIGWRAQDGHELHLLVEGSGPPVVLVHGVAGSARIFDALGPLLADRFQILRADLLGYGRSPKPTASYSPAVHVAALRATLSARGVHGPYALVGLSMGADLVLEWAASFPGEVAALVGLGFPYYRDEAAARRGLHHNFWTRLAIEHPNVARRVTPLAWAIGRHASGFASSRSTIYSPAMARETLSCRYLAFERSLRACLLDYRPDAALEASGAMPRLFVHGAEDRWASFDDVAAGLAPYEGSELVVLPGVAHNVAVLAPDGAADAIRRYLDRQLA